MRKKELIGRLEGLQRSYQVLGHEFKKQEIAIRELQQDNINHEERIQELERMVFSLKTNVKEEKQNDLSRRKQKWLNSYPDETEGDN